MPGHAAVSELTLAHRPLDAAFIDLVAIGPHERAEILRRQELPRLGTRHRVHARRHADLGDIVIAVVGQHFPLRLAPLEFLDLAKNGPVLRLVERTPVGRCRREIAVKRRRFQFGGQGHRQDDTGVKPGQEIALGLLSFVGKLIVVGFSVANVEYNISKLMAFDAEMIGTWGCLPQYYPKVLEMVLDGRIQVGPFVETRPLGTIEATFEEAHAGKLQKRVVLVPNF